MAGSLWSAFGRDSRHSNPSGRDSPSLRVRSVALSDTAQAPLHIHRFGLGNRRSERKSNRSWLASADRLPVRAASCHLPSPFELRRGIAAEQLPSADSCESVAPIPVHL